MGIEIQGMSVYLMAIAKYCMLNEMESTAILYIIKTNTKKKWFTPSLSSHEIITNLYYLGLYVKEVYNDKDYFRMLINGQNAICDLYIMNYVKWREKNIPKKFPDFASFDTFTQINKLYDELLRVEKPQVAQPIPIDEMISFIIESSKKPKLVLANENPMSHAIRLEKHKCEEYMTESQRRNSMLNNHALSISIQSSIFSSNIPAHNNHNIIDAYTLSNPSILSNSHEIGSSTYGFG